jgi:hypothetical protein
MMGWRSWKAAQRARWAKMTWGQQSGWLTGVVAFCATLIGVSMSVHLPRYWAGALTGFWTVWTFLGIWALVTLQRRHRRHRPPA